MEREHYSRKRITNKATLNKARVETQILQEEFDSGMQVLEQIKKQRDYIINQVKLELKQQKDLKSKIAYLKKEYKLLQMSHAANENILKTAKANREELQQEVAELEETLKKVKNRNQNMLIQNDFARLIEVVNLAGADNQKEKSVLLTCVRDLIKTTEENEFEGISWKAKYATGKNSLGVRIRFDELSIGQQDLKNIYKPIISELAQKFKKYHLRLETRTRSHQGIISSLDITLKLPTEVRRANALGSELR